MITLATWDSTGVACSYVHAQQFGQNAIELGNLLSITAFNPDNPNADVAMDAVQEWIQVRKDYLNGVQRDDYPAGMDISTARQQLGMMGGAAFAARSEEHTYELQSLMRIPSAVFCCKKKK